MTPRPAEITRLNAIRSECEREWQSPVAAYRTIDIIRTDGSPVPRKLQALIIDDACRKYGTNLPQMRSTTRMQYVVKARREAMWRLRTQARLSLPQIGRMFDKHHTSVLHAVREYERGQHGTR